MLRIIQQRNIWLSISGILVMLSVLAVVFWGFNYGLDFTGGSFLDVKFTGTRPTPTAIEEALKPLDIGEVTAQPVGDANMVLRFKEISQEKFNELVDKLNSLTIENKDQAAKDAKKNNQLETKNVEVMRYDSIGPAVGHELKVRAFYAVFFVLLAILIYVAWAFRNVSKPIASWKYGVATLIALFHDVFIVLGVFALLGKFYGVEINTPFIAAVLTVLGYSVNDTIVVFDRIRENLPKSDENFEGTVNISLNQTLVRSINTSLTVMLVLLSVIFLGGSSIRDFVLALAIGIFVGTYSSIFIASPALVVWEKMQNK
jgi:preprotein translocase subunit SecF